MCKKVLKINPSLWLLSRPHTITQTKGFSLSPSQRISLVHSNIPNFVFLTGILYSLAIHKYFPKSTITMFDLFSLVDKRRSHCQSTRFASTSASLLTALNKQIRNSVCYPHQKRKGFRFCLFLCSESFLFVFA